MVKAPARPICAKCKVVYVVKNNSVIVREKSVFNIYAYYCADVWECPICKHQIVGGFGMHPLSDHFERDFPKTLESLKKRTILTFKRI